MVKWTILDILIRHNSLLSGSDSNLNVDNRLGVLRLGLKLQLSLLLSVQIERFMNCWMNSKAAAFHLTHALIGI